MKLERLLLSYLKARPRDFWDLVRYFGFMPPYIQAVKNLQKRGLILVKNSRMTLTPKGRTYAEKIEPRDPEPKKLDLKLYREIRPKMESLVKYDQLPITIQAAIKKVNFINKRDGLEDRAIACLGDDDWMGIALALTGLPKRVTVFDLDERVLENEKKVAEKYGLEIEAVRHDFRKPLPKKYRQKYDIFITEPPDTLPGLLLFFSRGLELLNGAGKAGYIGVATYSLSRDKWLEFEKGLLKMSVVITDALHDFEPYEVDGKELEWISGLPKGVNPPKKPWYYATLFRAETTQKAKPLYKGEFKTGIIEEVFITRIKG